MNLMLNYAWNENFYGDDDGDDKIPSLEVGAVDRPEMIYYPMVYLWYPHRLLFPSYHQWV
jgi:hypothetical protein